MGRRDYRWGEVDSSFGGGESDDDYYMGRRVITIDYSIGCEVDGETTLVEIVDFPMSEGGDENTSLWVKDWM
ncbi:hypothetical protein KI387_037195, partial [Taxus chinensis]